MSETNIDTGYSDMTTGIDHVNVNVFLILLLGTFKEVVIVFPFH